MIIRNGCIQEVGKDSAPDPGAEIVSVLIDELNLSQFDILGMSSGAPCRLLRHCLPRNYYQTADLDVKEHGEHFSNEALDDFIKVFIAGNYESETRENIA